MKILLVEDDQELAKVTCRLLEKENYIVDHVHTLTLAKVVLNDVNYPLVLLDRLLPDGEGTELISFARDRNSCSKFILLSALDETEQKVEGLDLGADDYITKPFEPVELLARIRASIRRPQQTKEEKLKLGDLIFNVLNRSFSIRGEALILPRRELTILEALVNRGERVVAREFIESAMYGFDEHVSSNTLESHISRLRKNLVKIKAGLEIHTIRGIGYMISENKS